MRISNIQCDKDGRTIALDINVDGEYFHLVNIYAPVDGVNSTYADQDVYYSTIHRFVYSRYPTMVGGDFNCVDNPALDCTSYDVHKLISYKSQNLISLCQIFDIHDALRITNVNSFYFTWHGPTVASRLDRFYVSTAVNVNLCKVDTATIGCIFVLWQKSFY